MKHLKLVPILAALAIVLAGCIPGLGTMEPVPVTVETPHIAVATFTPMVDVTDVIVNFAGGDIDHVRAEDERFQCQAFRGDWDCFVTGQDDPGPPRLVHPAGEPVRFIIYAGDSSRTIASVYWRASD